LIKECLSAKGQCSMMHLTFFEAETATQSKQLAKSFACR